MHNEKGITLIALAVTIIVLLILASISIATLTGDNGIIDQADKAKLEAEIMEEREKVDIAATNARAQWGDLTETNFENELNMLIGYRDEVYKLQKRNNQFIVTYIVSDRSYTVDLEGNLIGESSGGTTEDDDSEEASDLKWIYHENEDGDIEITGVDLSEYEYTQGIGQDWYNKFIVLNIEKFVVPSKLEGKDVVKFDWKDSRYAFEANRWEVLNVDFVDVKKIVYPDTIEEICNTSDGWDITFSAVEEIKLPSNLKILGNWAITGCSSLQNIEIPDSVISIGYAAFRDCSSLTNINLPENVVTIGEKAFIRCTSLSSIEIPKGVTSIGDRTFENCTNLTSIEISEGVTSIGTQAFYNCTNLTSIEIPEGVTSIGDEAFKHCSGLTSVIIPQSIISIGTQAFYDCTNLTSIEIPESVTSIENGVFLGCTRLTSIIIPKSVTSIGYNAFYSCSGLTTVNYKGTVEQWGEISIGLGNKNLTNATINYEYTGE